MSLLSTELLLQILGVLVGVCGFVYIYLKHVTFEYWSTRGIAQTTPIVPVGDLWPVFTAKKSMGEHTRDEYLKFRGNPVLGMYSLWKPTLAIREPHLIQFVLTQKFSLFQDRGLYCNEKSEPLSGHLFNLPGAKWRNLRFKLSPTFTSGKIKYMFVTIKECSEKLAEYFAKEVERNDLIEIRDFMARFSTDVIASVAFGIECNSMENPQDEFRVQGRKLLEAKPIRNALCILFPSAVKLLGLWSIDKGVSHFFIRAFRDTVEYRRAKKIVRKDFLELLIQLMEKRFEQSDDGEESTTKSESAHEKITMLEGAAQAFVFWLGGFETSSSTATHCLYELAFHQDIQDKLASEIKTVIEEFGGVTYDSIAAMPYLHMVVSETLRKYPSIPFLNRQATEDVKLPEIDLVVARGTAIVIPVYGLHSDPDIYPDPHVFDPERFTKENIKSRHHYAYLPFGEGPRNCIGMRFGLLQTKIGLITLLNKFRFLPGPETDVPLPVDKGNFVLCPAKGVVLRVQERCN
ncbi:probable cytochrome P450 6a14 [Athalia rosae]|uniref:probable cytochrome P450 6a14 n=1 Tax=Athalia rosae TaxID=37344 RepID=UPI002033753D|nr:probable cytochrome P450 6a14 [Athalia rosae]